MIPTIWHFAWAMCAIMCGPMAILHYGFSRTFGYPQRHWAERAFFITAGAFAFVLGVGVMIWCFA